MNADLPTAVTSHFKMEKVDGKYQAVPRGVPEGGLLPDRMTVTIHNTEGGESWLEMPPPGSVMIGGKPFKVSDYKDIPIILDDGRPVEPEVPTRWQKFKSRLWWKWEGVRSRVAHWIYPEGFEEDW